MSTPTHLRRDAERNHEAIVTAAIAVLADAPEATMAEIANASGIGRSTLYRHFPDRAALVAAILRRVIAEAESLVQERLRAAPAGDAVAVMVELGDALAGLGDRYRFMQSQEERRQAKHPDGHWRLGLPARRYLADAQAAGAVRDDLPADWLFDMFAHTVAAAAKQQFPSGQTRRDVIAVTLESLLTPPH